MGFSRASGETTTQVRSSGYKYTGKALLAGAAVALLGLGSALPSQAVDIQNPGTTGDFTWEGFNWDKRDWGGGPHYNGQWQASNVSDPDANGAVTLSITNPTGNAPQASEFQTTRRGFGYGTYTTTVEKQVDAMQPEVVWGCMFTYDPDAQPGFNEIDLCEASAWGGGASYGQAWPITQGHGYWFDAAAGPGSGNSVVTFTPPATLVQTHKLVWEKDKLTYETYEGEGTTGKLVKSTVLTGYKVPEPAQERIHYNFWVVGGNGGDPDHVKPEQVKIKSFDFSPATTPTPAPSVTTKKSIINLSAVAYKPASGYYVVLRWNGAKGDTVDLYLNGVKTVIPNNGYYKYMRPAGAVSTTFKLCDYTKGCSITYKVSKW